MGRAAGQRARRGWPVAHAFAGARSRKARETGSNDSRDTAQSIETAPRGGADATAAIEVEAVA